jgi:hypothetical protein
VRYQAARETKIFKTKIMIAAARVGAHETTKAKLQSTGLALSCNRAISEIT